MNYYLYTFISISNELFHVVFLCLKILLVSILKREILSFERKASILQRRMLYQKEAVLAIETLDDSGDCIY